MKHIVSHEEQGTALRSVLRRGMKLSGTAVRSAKWNGQILMNGKPATVDRIVSEGDVIEFLAADASPVRLPAPYALPLSVVYEDEYLFVIDKPAPLASQEGRRHDSVSLENALYAHLGCPENYLFRPVNRLDKGTSGLMTVARDAHTQDLLQRQLHTDTFVRRYLAVTEGVPSPERGTIDLPIAKEDGPTIRRVPSSEGRPCKTHYRVLRKERGRALIKLQLETGRTHQIRVHLSAINCPIVGDFLYGTEIPELPGRFALHSSELSLIHPITGEALHFVSSLPRELERLLAAESQPQG